jgi:hypothetical protein
MRSVLRRFRVAILAVVLSVAGVAATAPVANAWAWSSQVTVNGTVSCNGLVSGREAVGFFYIGDGRQGGFQRTQSTSGIGGNTNRRKSFSQTFTVPGDGLTLTVIWSCGDGTAWRETKGLKRPRVGNTATFNFAPNANNRTSS